MSVSTKTAPAKPCDLVHKCGRTRVGAGDARVLLPAARPLLQCALVIASLFLMHGEPLLAATLQEAEARQADAETARAALLSPTRYLRGTQALDRARETADSNARQQAIDDSVSAFNAAIENVATAGDVLSDTLISREAAMQSEAFRLAAGDWAQAEKTLNDAVRALEKGKEPAARKRGDRATELYREAQLNALKAQYLSAARNALLDAEQAKAERLAPRSFARAQALLAQAQAALEADRSQTDEAAALADAAAYQARLASYIASQAQRVRSKDASIEDLILESQAVVARLATTAGTSADFSNGFASAESQLRNRLERVPVLEAELEQNRRLVAGLEEEIRELDQRLGSTSAERRSLMQRVEADARVREQFALVETLFTPEEAVVLRNGDELILRMVGLRFPSGSAKLDDEARALLNRLETAIDVFPRCQVRVEGHTDSSGRPKRNQALSQERATAVANYLVETTGIQEFRVRATGYGDGRPVTSNRTREGRAQNRRIDVVIIPRPSGA